MNAQDVNVAYNSGISHRRIYVVLPKNSPVNFENELKYISRVIVQTNMLRHGQTEGREF